MGFVHSLEQHTFIGHCDVSGAGSCTGFTLGNTWSLPLGGFLSRGGDGCEENTYDDDYAKERMEKVNFQDEGTGKKGRQASTPTSYMILQVTLQVTLES